MVLWNPFICLFVSGKGPGTGTENTGGREKEQEQEKEEENVHQVNMMDKCLQDFLLFKDTII